jgi:uncharacterized protein (DUF433 family)
VVVTLQWSDYPLVEIIPGKISGTPVLKNTCLPVEAITGTYDAFRDEGLSPDAAIAETLDCDPEARIDAIRLFSTIAPRINFMHCLEGSFRPGRIV